MMTIYCRTYRNLVGFSAFVRASVAERLVNCRLLQVKIISCQLYFLVLLVGSKLFYLFTQTQQYFAVKVYIVSVCYVWTSNLVYNIGSLVCRPRIRHARSNSNPHTRDIKWNEFFFFFFSKSLNLRGPYAARKVYLSLSLEVFSPLFARFIIVTRLFRIQRIYFFFSFFFFLLAIEKQLRDNYTEILFFFFFCSNDV